MPKTDNKGPADFLRSLEWKIKIDWFGKAGVHKIDENRNAKLTVYDPHTSGTYTLIQVEIVHKLNGKIDVQSIKFNDYLSERKDSRPDHAGPFEVISHCGWDWYIAVPKSTRPLCAAVESYIDRWR